MSKKINILKYAKFQGVIFTLIGFLLGIFYSFGGLIVDSLITLNIGSPIIWEHTPGLSYGTFLAFLSLISIPLYFGGIGFLLGLVGGFLFNKLKHPFKNMEIDFEEKEND